jgi:hypothetical protein
MTQWIGIISGSRVYAIDGLQDPRWISVDTAWGAPVGRSKSKPLMFPVVGRTGRPRLRRSS